MTLDDQLRALLPLKPGQIAELAGYSSGSNQLTSMRAVGRRMSDERLRAIARRLREIAETADALIPHTP